MWSISIGRRQSPITCSARIEACAVSVLEMGFAGGPDSTPLIAVQAGEFRAAVTFGLRMTIVSLPFRQLRVAYRDRCF
jgi:hypothetical protein